LRRQRAIAAPIKTVADAINTKSSQTGSVEVETVETTADPLFPWRAPAGSVNTARFLPLAACRATREGSVVPTAGRPGLGVWPPVAAGIVSQYWLSALSAGLMQPGTFSALEDEIPKALSDTATATRRKSRNMMNPIAARC
jgi:hypothetical protein